MHPEYVKLNIPGSEKIQKMRKYMDTYKRHYKQFKDIDNVSDENAFILLDYFR